jgi:hypothetical protein
VGDTVEADPLLSDEEIAFMLSEERDPLLAAAALCEAISARFARMFDRADGDVRMSYSQRSKAYADRAAELRVQAGKRTAPTPFAGGLSVSAEEEIASDPDRPQPAFRFGMHDNYTPGDLAAAPT